MAVVLGIDTGFAACGYSRVELSLDSEDVQSAGVVRTAKSSHKQDYKAADDNIRRGREIAQTLIPLGEGVVALCVESPSLPRNASTSFKLGICYGILCCLTEFLAVPVVMVSPQELKKGVCGDPKASKADIAAAIDQRFSRDFGAELIQRGIPKGAHEHAYDAIGAVISSFDTEIVRMARRMP
jgi:Holliday junction resolvasome RuvABC endonuclease subunit